MRIDEIGGEFVLIERLVRHAPVRHKDLVTGIGDDAAVIDHPPTKGELLLVTTDMLVANRHFMPHWAAPTQIGFKAVTCNASDIAAMGGTPTFMFVAIALETDSKVAWVEDLYRGMADACRQYSVVLAGGDTTRGEILTISITMMGRVAKPSLCLRSHARPGDLLCVTGALGGSAAGLALLTLGLKSPEAVLTKHLAPSCRLDISPTIAPLARAMIDISDGLASEVNHICDRSKTGARIIAQKIPLDPSVREAAAIVGKDPLAWALSGGEDFELLFSISREKHRQLEKKGIRTYTVGEVTKASHGRVLVMPDGSLEPIAGGFDHFG